MFRLGTEIVITASSSKNKSSPRVGSRGYITSIRDTQKLILRKNLTVKKITATAIFYRFGYQKKHRLEKGVIDILIPTTSYRLSIQESVQKIKNIVDNSVRPYKHFNKRNSKFMSERSKRMRGPLVVMASEVIGGYDLKDDNKLIAAVVSCIHNRRINAVLGNACGPLIHKQEIDYTLIKELLSPEMREFIQLIFGSKSKKRLVSNILSARDLTPGLLTGFMLIISLLNSIETKETIQNIVEDAEERKNIDVKKHMLPKIKFRPEDLYDSLFKHQEFNALCSTLSSSPRYERHIQSIKDIKDTLKSNASSFIK